MGDEGHRSRKPGLQGQTGRACGALSGLAAELRSDDELHRGRRTPARRARDQSEAVGIDVDQVRGVHWASPRI